MILTDIKNLLTIARKNKTEDIAFLSTVVAEIVMIGKNNGNRETTEEETLVYLNKLKKNNLEVISLAEKNNRLETINKVKHELTIIDQFLPKQLTEEELKNIIIEEVNKLPEKNKKSMGIIMKFLKANYNQQYEGKLASKIINEILH